LIRPLLVALAGLLTAAAAPFWAIVAALTAIAGLVWLVIDIFYMLAHW